MPRQPDSGAPVTAGAEAAPRLKAPKPFRLADLGVAEDGYPTMGEKAFELFRMAILCGALRPGEVLRIKDLVSASGMSRMPVREALARLERTGLVESTPRHSARVARLSGEDLKDVYDVRLQLEVPAIIAAARKNGEDDAALADHWLERLAEMTAAGDDAGAMEAHSAFHLALYRASSSSWLHRLLRPLWDCSERYRTAGRDGVSPAAEMEDHERLRDACYQRQAELAGTLLWNHLAETANRISHEMEGKRLYLPKPVPSGSASGGQVFATT